MSISLSQSFEQGEPRTVKRGENSPVQSSPSTVIHLDWLSYTFQLKPGRLDPVINPGPLPSHAVMGHGDPAQLPIEVRREIIALERLIPHGLRFVIENRGWQGYTNMITFHRDNGQNGLIAWGGNCNTAGVETVHVSISGAGMVLADPSRFYDHLVSREASLRRIDIAMDDYARIYTGDWAVKTYQEGGFNYDHGRPPKLRVILNDGHLETVYIGTREAGKMLRCYDKGVQSGMDDRGKWWRTELEWRASARRSIPLDALLNPQAYFAGSYPALSFAAMVPIVVKTIVREVCSSLRRKVQFVRVQGGKVIGLLRRLGLSADEICSMLEREGMPGGLPGSLAEMTFDEVALAEGWAR